MTVISLFLLGLLTVVDARFNCALPEDFQKENPDLHTKAFKALRPNTKYLLHDFLYDNGTYLGKGAFGDVRAAAGVTPKVVMKKILSRNEAEDKNLNTELTLLKQLCGIQTETPENKLVECDSKVIAGFRGCVENGDEVFIFQELMTMDLDKLDAQKMYRALDGMKKAKVMLDLIRKFEQIHDKGIVHSDIKPANIIVKNNDLSDLRVVDFGFALNVNTESKNETPLYLPPKRSNNIKVVYGDNVYSLAITFMTLEEGGLEGLNKIHDECSNNFSSSTCRSQLEKTLKEAFSVKNKTEFLLEVFKRAADPNPNTRYETMKEFANAVEEATKNRGLQTEKKGKMNHIIIQQRPAVESLKIKSAIVRYNR